MTTHSEDPRTPAALRDPDRLRSVAALDLDDPQLRGRLDALAERTRAALGIEIGLFTVVLDSAQVIVGSAGLTGWIAEAGGTPAEWAFCSQLVGSGRAYVVEDARVDPIQKDNPLVFADGLECYLGVPLVDAEGRVLGGHCVLDRAPRHFTEAEIATLEDAAREASALLDAHRRAPAA